MASRGANDIRSRYIVFSDEMSVEHSQLPPSNIVFPLVIYEKIDFVKKRGSL